MFISRVSNMVNYCSTFVNSPQQESRVILYGNNCITHGKQKKRPAWKKNKKTPSKEIKHYGKGKRRYIKEKKQKQEKDKIDYSDKFANPLNIHFLELREMQNSFLMRRLLNLTYSFQGPGRNLKMNDDVNAMEAACRNHDMMYQ